MDLFVRLVQQAPSSKTIPCLNVFHALTSLKIRTTVPSGRTVPNATINVAMVPNPQKSISSVKTNSIFKLNVLAGLSIQ